MLEQKERKPEAVNPDESESLEGWTDCPGMVLKVLPEMVSTWVLGKKRKGVKALQRSLKRHLKETGEIAKNTDLRKQPPSNQKCCTALGNPNHSTELLPFVELPSQLGSIVVSLRESHVKLLSREDENSLRTPGHTSTSIKKALCKDVTTVGLLYNPSIDILSHRTIRLLVLFRAEILTLQRISAPPQ